MGGVRVTDTGCHTVWTGVGDWVGWWPKGEKRVIARSEVGNGNGNGNVDGNPQPTSTHHISHTKNMSGGAEKRLQREKDLNLRIS